MRHLNGCWGCPFELGNMKHRVHSRGSRELQFVCHRTDFLQNVERDKEPKRKLVASVRSDCQFHIRFEFEEYHITH
jgi:hypothetical protein